jgi:hypothetical protein
MWANAGHYYIAFTAKLRRSGGYVKLLGMGRRLMPQSIFKPLSFFPMFWYFDAAGSR